MSHNPVMLSEMLDHLAPQANKIYLDATFGGGGYTEAILQAASCHVYAIDRDPDAITRGKALCARYPDRLTLLHGSFSELVDLLHSDGVMQIDGAVFDLGVSSFQLDDPARGFSFRFDGPLDMRMDPGAHVPTAADLMATVAEKDLATILFTLGEERQSRRIARAIIAARDTAPITTTSQLARIIRSVMPKTSVGIDPATRSFQALRLYINNELGEITAGLQAALSVLQPAGRLIAVAFHSLEDRIVKQFMIQAAGRSPVPSRHDPRHLLPPAEPSDFALLTPRAVRPTAHEIAHNPRSRSARLRAIRRLPHPPISQKTSFVMNVA